MLRVVVHTFGDPPRPLDFEGPGPITFGRAPENDIVIDESYVSRLHGELFCEDGAWYVSNRGTLTDIAILRESETSVVTRGLHMQIQDGDTVRIVHSLLRIEIKPDTQSEQPYDAPRENAALPLFAADDDTAELLTEASLSDLGTLHRSVGAETTRLELLLELAKDLIGLTDLSDILDRISRAVFEAFPTASHFAIAIPLSDGRLEPRFGALRDGTKLPLDEIVLSKAILEAVVVRESAMLFDAATTHSKTLINNRIASSLAVPLHGSADRLGVMQVDNRISDAAFSERDLDFGILLAQSTAHALERARLQRSIQRMFDGFVSASVTAIEARDPTTSGHSRRVAAYSVRLAEAANRRLTGSLGELDFKQPELRELEIAALLHDFGKVGVRECVLLKANRLFPEQLERIESRFRLIRALQHSMWVRDALRLDPSSRSARQARDRLDARFERLDRQLESALEIVRAANTPGPVSDAQAVQLQGIAQLTYPREDDSPAPWLEDEELESLCIRRGTLSPEQRAEIQAHVSYSYEVLRQIPWPDDLVQVPRIVHGHHERLDQSGYPLGCDGDLIPPQTRILIVADVFDALTAADRPYRSAISVEQGLDELRQDACNGKIDPEYVDLFIDARVWERPANDDDTK